MVDWLYAILSEDEDFGVEAEAVAEAVEQGADDEFGFGMFAADPAHVPTSAGFGEAVFVHSKVLDRINRIFRN